MLALAVALCVAAAAHAAAADSEGGESGPPATAANGSSAALPVQLAQTDLLQSTFWHSRSATRCGR